MPISGGGGGSSAGSLDGWIPANETWVYASATTFTVVGVNRTARYTPGTRLQLTNSAAVKYFVVVSSAFSTDTTVTVTGGSDYSLANAAISANSYSYAANPQGYPGWFNFADATTGITSPTVTWARFAVVGRVCQISYDVSGTSNAATKTFTLPIAAASGSGVFMCIGLGKDNGTNQTAVPRLLVNVSSATATVTKDGSGAAWTNTGAWQYTANFAYEI